VGTEEKGKREMGRGGRVRGERVGKWEGRFDLDILSRGPEFLVTPLNKIKLHIF